MFANSRPHSTRRNDGFGKRFRVIADAMLGIDGALTTRTDGLGQQLQRNQKDQDALRGPPRRRSRSAARPVHRARHDDGAAERARAATSRSRSRPSTPTTRASEPRPGAARRGGRGEIRLQIGAFGALKSPGAIPILQASPLEKTPPAMFAPAAIVPTPPPAPSPAPTARVGVETGVDAADAAPAGDDAVRRLRRRDRRRPAARSRRATSRPSARRSAAPSASSTKA